ncbi:MAG: hemerythrin domain-containing protein [Candidatus Eremiobacteraeota bacterium]|nr:hemerythrin domain-containing protein [Candidatus Eremiobacteraeota bacterium]
MDAIALLKEDHRVVEALFKQVEECGAHAHETRKRLFERIHRELTIHSEVEESIFYPELKKRAIDRNNEHATEEVFEAFEEHANIKGMLSKLTDVKASDETYNAKLQVLSELVKQHVHEEEQTMFKQAQSLFTQNELMELGEKIAAKKKSLVGAGNDMQVHAIGLR